MSSATTAILFDGVGIPSLLDGTLKASACVFLNSLFLLTIWFVRFPFVNKMYNPTKLSMPQITKSTNFIKFSDSARTSSSESYTGC